MSYALGVTGMGRPHSVVHAVCLFWINEVSDRVPPAPAYSNYSDSDTRSAIIEGLDVQYPSLIGWCERFCRDPASIKSYAPE